LLSSYGFGALFAGSWITNTYLSSPAPITESIDEEDKSGENKEDADQEGSDINADVETPEDVTHEDEHVAVQDDHVGLDDNVEHVDVSQVELGVPNANENG